MNIKISSYLTTGQASEILAVTPDTILKWIKQGRLPAIRTAGGHYRISSEVVNALLAKNEANSSPQSSAQEELLHCFEFFALEGRLRSECKGCLVYRSRAVRCYEAKPVLAENSCAWARADVCESCSYYMYLNGKPLNIIMISEDISFRQTLQHENEGLQAIKLCLAASGYECSLLIGNATPDAIIVDGQMPLQKFNELYQNLSADPRLSTVTIIMALTAQSQTAYPNAMTIERPFSLKEILDLIRQEK